MKKWILFRIMLIFIIATKLTANPMDELILGICHSDGLLLYANCVAVPVTTTEQVAACSALKFKYLACLTQLTLPGGLTPALDPDPYVLSPWSPCKFETSHLVLPEVCISL